MNRERGAAGRRQPDRTANEENCDAIFARTADLFDHSEIPLGAWPKPESLEGRFLARLMRGGEITSRDWLAAVHSMRLATEAHDLRELGWSVKTKRVTVTTADRGRVANIGSYRLNERQRVAAVESDQGREFLAAVALAERGSP